jgi:hypothetical protein
MELLADEKYVEAYNLTYHDPGNQWSPAILESVINGYGLLYEPGEEVFKVTSPNTAILDGRSKVYKDIDLLKEHHTKFHLPDMDRIGHLRYDLPLNGVWSDLTATFYLLQGDDFWALELDEIHVF